MKNLNPMYTQVYLQESHANRVKKYGKKAAKKMEETYRKITGHMKEIKPGGKIYAANYNAPGGNTFDTLVKSKEASEEAFSALKRNLKEIKKGAEKQRQAREASKLNPKILKKS